MSGFWPRVARGLDRAVGLVSPAAEVKRITARAAAEHLRGRLYAAAKTNLSTGRWTPPDHKVNALLAGSLPALRARARQLVRDMPAMATAVQRLEEFTVGPGLTLQARVKGPDGKLDKRVNQAIEDAWAFWCDEADDAGRLCFGEIQQLAARSEVELGEYLVVKKASRARGRGLPLSLQLFEPDQLSAAGGTALPGNEILQGVEYDPRTGRAVAYHFEDGARFTRIVRIPADRVVCGFKTLRPGQLRGVTPLAPALLLAHSLRDYIEAEVESAQKAARWLAFVTSPDPAGTMAALGASLSPADTTTDGSQQYVMEFGNAIVDFLKTGEQVTIANHNRPGDSFVPFTRWVLQSFAATVGVTYELLSGDYKDAAYTGARVARNDMLAGIRVRRARLTRQLCENVRREFMDWAVLAGKIDLPTYFRDPAPFLRAVWLGPGMEALDPLREGRADADAVVKLLKSPQEVLLARGRDPEQVLDERKEWDDMLADRGLVPAQTQAPLASNPAAVAPGTGEGEEPPAPPASPEDRAEGPRVIVVHERVPAAPPPPPPAPPPRPTVKRIRRQGDSWTVTEETEGERYAAQG